MNKSELVVKIANDAISHIRDFALDAIKAVASEAEFHTAPTKTSTSVEEPKRGRGRPRNTEVEKPVEEVAPVIEESTPVVEEAVEQAPVEVEVVENTPEKYSVDWFKANLEEGRELCRNVLTKVLADNGGNAEQVKQSMFELTGKTRVSVFTAEDCEKYFREMSKPSDAGDLM